MKTILGFPVLLMLFLIWLESCNLFVSTVMNTEFISKSTQLGLILFGVNLVLFILVGVIAEVIL